MLSDYELNQLQDEWDEQQIVDAVQSEEFEPCYDGDAAFLVDEIATCKAIGDAGGTRAAIDALVSYIDGEE